MAVEAGLGDVEPDLSAAPTVETDARLTAAAERYLDAVRPSGPAASADPGAALADQLAAAPVEQAPAQRARSVGRHHADDAAVVKPIDTDVAARIRRFGSLDRNRRLRAGEHDGEQAGDRSGETASEQSHRRAR